MIARPAPERFRLRRTMMFLSAQKPGLIKDAYIYGADSLILDLEDAVAVNQKDAARFSLDHTLKPSTMAAQRFWCESTVWTPLTGGRISGSA